MRLSVHLGYFHHLQRNTLDESVCNCTSHLKNDWTGSLGVIIAIAMCSMPMMCWVMSSAAPLPPLCVAVKVLFYFTSDVSFFDFSGAVSPIERPRKRAFVFFNTAAARPGFVDFTHFRAAPSASLSARVRRCFASCDLSCVVARWPQTSPSLRVRPPCWRLVR